jgi:hypothetical protein
LLSHYITTVSPWDPEFVFRGFYLASMVCDGSRTSLGIAMRVHQD